MFPSPWSPRCADLGKSENAKKRQKKKTKKWYQRSSGTERAGPSRNPRIRRDEFVRLPNELEATLSRALLPRVRRPLVGPWCLFLLVASFLSRSTQTGPRSHETGPLLQNGYRRSHRWALDPNYNRSFRSCLLCRPPSRSDSMVFQVFDVHALFFGNDRPRLPGPAN